MQVLAVEFHHCSVKGALAAEPFVDTHGQCILIAGGSRSTTDLFRRHVSRATAGLRRL
jgi:hypothetical protein